MQEDRAGFLLCKRAVHLLVPFVEWSVDKEAQEVTVRMDGKTKIACIAHLQTYPIDEVVLSVKQEFAMDLLFEGIPKSAPGLNTVKS